jgi:hypothetical protein
VALAALLALGATVLSGAGDPGRGTSQVSAEVRELLQTSAQPAALTIAVDQGSSSSVETLNLSVLSNVGAGYAATVRRTVFARGDLPVRVAGLATTEPQLVLDLPTSLTTLPAGPERAFGRRTKSISPAVGDRWRLRLVVGPVGCAETGLHAGVLAFTTRAGGGVEIAPVALVVNVRRDRRLCG